MCGHQPVSIRGGPCLLRAGSGRQFLLDPRGLSSARCSRTYGLHHSRCRCVDEPSLLARPPGKGFHSSDMVPQLVNITVPELAMRSIPIRPGVQVVCSGPLVSSTKLHVYNFAMLASIHFRPELDCTFGWECTHLFCGAFCGWSQAAEWLPNAGFGFTIGRQVFVDHDETILQLCRAQHNMDKLRCPLKVRDPWNPAGKIALLGDVADATIPYAHRCL